MSVGHYENFPVASLLVPARYRTAVVAIYRFARAADDIADEGDATRRERLAGLAAFERGLDAIERGETPNAPPFADLAPAIRTHALPIPLFRDLLSAFAQDVEVGRYATFDDVLDYCRRSANPVGRLLLALYRIDAPVALAGRKGRVYLPLEDLARFDVSLASIGGGRCDERWSRLMAFETARTRAMFERGRPLCARMPWRLALELRAVVAGGLRVLERIDDVHGDVFTRRPVLGRRDWALLALRMLAPAPAHST